MNNISYSDFKNICRMCMLSCDIKFPHDNVISVIFYKLTDINFEINDELPQQVCLKCYENIYKIHEFALKCKRTHTSLLKCINDFKNSQINEGLETLEGIKEPFKTETKEEITIDEHKIEFLKDEELNSTSEYVIVTDELQIKEEIEEYKINELEKKTILETGDDQNINCFEDDFLNRNSATENDINELKSRDVIVRTHRGQQRFKCKQCSKSFAHSSNLKRHMRTHNGERPFKCKQCFKSFIYPSNLKEHMRTHSGERPYQCNLCLKSFSRSFILVDHLRTHNGERPYKCKQCSKSFSRSSYLKAHSHTHSSERPFKCKQCSKTFAYASILRNHMSWHSGERPSKSEPCSKSFSPSSILTSHMRTHSGECL